MQQGVVPVSMEGGVDGGGRFPVWLKRNAALAVRGWSIYISIEDGVCGESHSKAHQRLFTLRTRGALSLAPKKKIVAIIVLSTSRTKILVKYNTNSDVNKYIISSPTISGSSSRWLGVSQIIL